MATIASKPTSRISRTRCQPSARPPPCSSASVSEWAISTFAPSGIAGTSCSSSGHHDAARGRVLAHQQRAHGSLRSRASDPELLSRARSAARGSSDPTPLLRPSVPRRGGRSGRGDRVGRALWLGPSRCARRRSSPSSTPTTTTNATETRRPVGSTPGSIQSILVVWVKEMTNSSTSRPFPWVRDTGVNSTSGGKKLPDQALGVEVPYPFVSRSPNPRWGRSRDAVRPSSWRASGPDRRRARHPCARRRSRPSLAPRSQEARCRA